MERTNKTNNQDTINFTSFLAQARNALSCIPVITNTGTITDTSDKEKILATKAKSTGTNKAITIEYNKTTALENSNNTSLSTYLKNSNKHIDNNYEIYSHYELQEFYNTFFKEYKNVVYNTFDEWLTNEYIHLTMCVIKTKAYKQAISYAVEIINNRYDDLLFEDISQEIALKLWENKTILNDVKTTNDFFNNHSDILIDCFKVSDNYAYRNKTRHDSRKLALPSYGKDTDNENLQEFIYTSLIYTDNINFMLDIEKSINSYIKTTEKSFISSKCEKVLHMLLFGYSRKQIASKTGYNKVSITKYHKIIKNAYDMLYNGKFSLDEEQFKKYLENKGIKQDKPKKTIHTYIQINTNNLGFTGTDTKQAINNLITKDTLQNYTIKALHNDSNIHTTKEQAQHNIRYTQALEGYNNYYEFLYKYTFKHSTKDYSYFNEIQFEKAHIE